MSAAGQKRTVAVRLRDVRLVPQADIRRNRHADKGVKVDHIVLGFAGHLNERLLDRRVLSRGVEQHAEHGCGWGRAASGP